MPKCQLCGKCYEKGSGSFFNVPKDEKRRQLWSDVCRVKFTPRGRICFDHFSPSDVVVSGKRKYLLNKAIPLLSPVSETSFVSDKNSELLEELEPEPPILLRGDCMIMRKCQLCGKKLIPGQGTAFSVPKDEERRRKWSEICKVNFTRSARVCADHFSSTDMVNSGKNKFLLPKAIPNVNTIPKTSFQGVSTLDNTITYEESCMPIFQGNELIANTHLENIWLPPLTEIDPLHVQSHKDQQTQTVRSGFQNLETALKQCREKMRQLETENKELNCKLYKASLAVDAMRKIFSEGQIRKLMSPSFVQWSWEDITNAIYLHELGPRAYNHLYDKGFPLPHSSTLQRWCRKIDRETENKKLNEEINAPSIDESKKEQNSECDSSEDDDTTESTAY